LFTFAKNVYTEAQKVRSFYEISTNEKLEKDYISPKNFDPKALYSIMYHENAKLQQHQDGTLGWVLLVSIGDSCVFKYSETQNSSQIELKIDSGDIILFNGQKLFHGVERIIPNTAPKWWKNSETYGMARFNIQFRDSKTWNQN
jgi:alkylated DNA repair dioxygenase AlkB